MRDKLPSFYLRCSPGESNLRLLSLSRTDTQAGSITDRQVDTGRQAGRKRASHHEPPPPEARSVRTAASRDGHFIRRNPGASLVPRHLKGLTSAVSLRGTPPPQHTPSVSPAHRSTSGDPQWSSRQTPSTSLCGMSCRGDLHT